MNLLHAVELKFTQKYGERPFLLRSPGRVNLIGEHTDYNLGFVLPAAIDKAIYFAIKPRADKRCRVFALDVNEEHTFEIDNFQRTRASWPNYLLGVVDQLNKSHYSLRGFDCVFGGDIPIGAGLSSSAALEAGLAFALNAMFELKLDRLTLAKIARKAENEFVGVQCGIMDQYINLFGEQGKVLRLDCRSYESTSFPFDDDSISIVLFDSCVSHALASSEYNQRRNECSAGVDEIKEIYPQVRSLRDVSREMLSDVKLNLEPTIYRRCRYVVEENQRLLDACDMLTSNDLKGFGALMYRTHDGLRNDYDVSCPELDYLVDLTRNEPSVYGARMMGGGFGGCTINLVENGSIERITRKVAEGYLRKFGKSLKPYVTTIGAGTGFVSAGEGIRTEVLDEPPVLH